MANEIIKVTTDTTVGINTSTNTIVKKGYSPFVGEDGNWFEYDDKTKKFIDTNIKAQGIQGEKGEKGEKGTTNYIELENKPSINGVELIGNKTAEELQINQINELDGSKTSTSNWAMLAELPLGVFKVINGTLSIKNAANYKFGLGEGAFGTINIHSSGERQLSAQIGSSFISVKDSVNKASITATTAQLAEKADKKELENINTQVSQKQDKLTAGENITIENNVISATVHGTTDYNKLENVPIKNLALSMTEYTMLTDIADGCYIVTEKGYISTTGGKSMQFSVGTEIIIATYNGVKTGTYQTGKAVALFNDNMTAGEKSFTWLNTSHKDLQITENATDSKIPTSKAVKDYVANKIDKSQVGNGLKFADGMLQLDIPVASATTTYGGIA